MKLSKKILLIIIINVFPTNELYENCVGIKDFNESFNLSNLENTDLKNYFFEKIKSQKLNELRINEDETSKMIEASINNLEVTIRLIDLKKKSAEEEFRILSILKTQKNFTKLEKCVYDENKNHIYIIQKRYEKDLSKNGPDFIKTKSKLSRLKFYKKLIKIISSLHSLTYIHGEITPWNILTDKNFQKISLTNFESATKIGENSKGGSEATMPLEKYINKNMISKKEIDIYSLGMSIIIIEIGEEKILEFLGNSMWSVKMMAFESAKRKGLKIVRKVFLERLERPGVFLRVKRWFVGLFWDNRVERIYCFADLLRNMTSVEQGERLDLLNVVMVLNKIIEFYEPGYIQKSILKKDRKIEILNLEFDQNQKEIGDHSNNSEFKEKQKEIKDKENILKVEEIKKKQIEKKENNFGSFKNENPELENNLDFKLKGDEFNEIENNLDFKVKNDEFNEIEQHDLSLKAHKSDLKDTDKQVLSLKKGKKSNLDEIERDFINIPKNKILKI